MKNDRRHVRQLLRGLSLATVAGLILVGPVGAAQAHSAAAPAALAAATQAPADGETAVQLNTDPVLLTATDKDLVVKVRLAGLWEMPAGQMAASKGTTAQVRKVGLMISAQHQQLDALDQTAARQLNVKLPNQPTGEQQRWLDEMKNATGENFDAIFAMRLRAAHGKIFPAIAAVRAGTKNDVVRQLAQDANKFVIGHLTLLESTGFVQYDELPGVVAPPQGPIAKAASRASNGGIAVPLIWLILGVSLVAGMIATSRMIKPRNFGGSGRVPAGSAPRPLADVPLGGGPGGDLYPPARRQRVRT